MRKVEQGGARSFTTAGALGEAIPPPYRLGVSNPAPCRLIADRGARLAVFPFVTNANYAIGGKGWGGMDGVLLLVSHPVALQRVRRHIVCPHGFGLPSVAVSERRWWWRGGDRRRV